METMSSIQSCVFKMMAVYNAYFACKLCMLLNHQNGIKLIGNTFSLRNRLKDGEMTIHNLYMINILYDAAYNMEYIAKC